MKAAWILSGVGNEVSRLTYRPNQAGAAVTVHPVLTVADVCRLLAKSRRQVYRYLRMGRIRPCAQILGQWLIAKAEVDRVNTHHLPQVLKRFFWDVPLSSLSVETHRDFILARLLEEGDRPALQWLFRMVPRREVARFLKDRGAVVLSRRAWQFWANHFGLTMRSRRRLAWRIRGRSWGGVQ